MASFLEIKNSIAEKGGVPPFTLWSADYVDNDKDGNPIPGSGMRPQHGTFPDLDSVVANYLAFVNTSGIDIAVLEPEKIIDCREIQVYP